MIKLQKNLSDIKKSNLVYLIENKSDLKIIEFLNLDKIIPNKISNTIKKGKNKNLSFFIGNDSFEYLHIFYLNKKNKDTYIEFLGEKVKDLPSKMTLIANNDINLITLIDTCLLSRYKFEDYKTKKSKQKINIKIDINNKALVQDRLSTLENIILSRDLGETPSMDLTPEAFVKMVKNTKFKNIKIRILRPKDIEKKGLSLIHAVGKGSKNKPYMIIMERIVNKNNPSYGFVGKGITFDSGGIQVKPDNYMYEMKGDMCGAATTFAVMKEIDKKDLNVNVIACLCLAENAISGESYKPSDIIKSYSGQTVEIIHTDAEGRLILADGISYLSKNYKLNNIISIATLTGAVMVALGFRYAGIMGTDEKLINKFLTYSENNFEKYVKLPFDNYFIKKTKSEIADLKNLTEGIHAGSSMGGAFLSNFLLNNEKYTHIDIAGTAINSYESYGLYNKGMTGFGVDSISKIFLDLK